MRYKHCLYIFILFFFVTPSKATEFDNTLWTLDNASEQEFKAILTEYPEIVNYHSQDVFGKTLLHEFVSHDWKHSLDKNTNKTKLLLEAGADINARRYSDGRTPLHEAVKNQNIKGIIFLLQNGANPNIRTDSGNTPLHLSMSYLKKNPYLAVALISAGADVELADWTGKSSLKIMLRSYNQDPQLPLYFTGFVNGQKEYIKGNYEKAVEYFEIAASAVEWLSLNTHLSIDFFNKRVQRVNIFDYSSLSKSELKKRQERRALQASATKGFREGYRNNAQIIYAYLVQSYSALNRFEDVYKTFERSRSLLFNENLSQTIGSKITGASASGKFGILPIPTLSEIQKALPKNTALLIFGNAQYKHMTQLCITRDSVSGGDVNVLDVLKWTATSDKRYNEFIESNRGIVINSSNDQLKVDKTNLNTPLPEAIGYYRSLINTPQASDIEETKNLSKALYNLLIEPFSSVLKSKKNLIVIPHEHLAILPFEALINPKGDYLTQTHNVKYLPSATTLHLLQQRQYDKQRKPLLAFGGVPYKSPGDVSQRSTNKDYTKLGISDWTELPGTLEEAKRISQAVPAGEKLIGSKVNEADLKKMSENGSLGQYKVLHFATHGIVLPQRPDLAALVLSPGDDKEDGYLQMGEVAALNLRTDFVNLSACKTGLGEISKGEGIIGLPSAFFLAGAKSMSVTLWEIDDLGTSTFMDEMYKRKYKQNLPFDKAMHATKKWFASGKAGAQYSAPFYWAGFSYMGP